MPFLTLKSYLDKTTGEKMLELENLEGVYEDLYLVSSPRTIANPVADFLMEHELLGFE